ncbi:triphosphoribosyl-dephospho-CoA synthase [Methanopyrus sp.]
MGTVKELPVLFCESVVLEVLSGPKPGLVDPISPSSHEDMGPREFLACLPELRRCLEEALELGMKGKPVDELVRSLPAWNVDVITASGGPNSVRGIVFLGSVYCYSAGLEDDLFPFDRIRAVGRRCTEALWNRSETKCGRIRIKERLAGVFGEVASGMATARGVSLPVLRTTLRVGRSLEEAVVHSVLACMSTLEDAGIPRKLRGWVKRRASEVLRAGGPFTERGRMELHKFVYECVERGVSPGASADVTVVGLVLLLAGWGRDIVSPYRDPTRRWSGGAVEWDSQTSGEVGRYSSGGVRGRREVLKG